MFVSFVLRAGEDPSSWEIKWQTSYPLFEVSEVERMQILSYPPNLVLFRALTMANCIDS